MPSGCVVPLRVPDCVFLGYLYAVEIDDVFRAVVDHYHMRPLTRSKGIAVAAVHVAAR